MYNNNYYYVGTYYMYGVLRFRNFLRTPEYSGGSGVVLYYTSVPRCKSRQRSRASHRAACRKRAVKCAIANGGAAACWPVAYCIINDGKRMVSEADLPAHHAVESTVRLMTTMMTTTTTTKTMATPALPLALMLALVSTASAQATKAPINVPGWPHLPFPFETGIKTCFLQQACLMHISGLPGIDFSLVPPAIVPGGIGNETRQALSNIGDVAKAAGSSMDAMIECTVFISDSAPTNAFAEMNTAYKEFFGDIKPTRAAMFVKLVGNSLVEIKCSGWAPPN